MDLFECIIQALSGYAVDFKIKDRELAVVNRGNGNVLSVFEEESFSLDRTERYVEYIVQFSTQHCHFDAEWMGELQESILEYIKQILDDQVLPLEFYLDGKPRFGTEIPAEDLDRLSVSYLKDLFRSFNLDLLPFDYEIHSWSGKYDTGRRRVAGLKP